MFFRPVKAGRSTWAHFAGISHGFRVGTGASRKLNLYAPAAMVGYSDELAEAAKRGDSDPAGLAEVAKRYSMQSSGRYPRDTSSGPGPYPVGRGRTREVSRSRH